MAPRSSRWAARSCASGRATGCGWPAAGCPPSPRTGDDWAPDPREAVLLLHGWTRLGHAGPRRARAVPAPDGDRAGPRLPRPRRLGRRPDDVRPARGRGRGGGPRLARRARHPPGGARGLVDGRGHGARVRRRARATGGSPRPTSTPTRRRPMSRRRGPGSSPSSRDSVPPELAIVVASRMRVPFGRRIADQAFGRMARTAGADPRAAQPAGPSRCWRTCRCCSSTATPTRPSRCATRAGWPPPRPAGTRHLVVAGADHGAGPRGRPGRATRRPSTDHLRAAFATTRP